MSTPQDPEELFKQMVPQLSQQLEKILRATGYGMPPETLN